MFVAKHGSLFIMYIVHGFASCLASANQMFLSTLLSLWKILTAREFVVIVISVIIIIRGIIWELLMAEWFCVVRVVIEV